MLFLRSPMLLAYLRFQSRSSLKSATKKWVNTVLKTVIGDSETVVDKKDPFFRITTQLTIEVILGRGDGGWLPLKHFET